MKTNPRISVQPQAGQPMPARWQAEAKQRAAAADEAYRQRIENAWRGEQKPYSGNMAQDHRLSNWPDVIGEK